MNRLKNFLFGEQSLRQTMLKNSFWLTVSTVGSNLVKVVIVIYAARLLGAAEYGLFSYALSVAATFTILSDLGLNYLITINMVRRDEAHEEFFPTLMLLRVGLLAIIIVLTVAIGPFITKFPQARILIPLVALLVAFDDARSLLNSTARAENRMDKEALGHIVTNSLIVVLSLIGLRYSHTSFMLTLAYLTGSALGTLMVFWTVRKAIRGVFRPLKFNLALAKDILAMAIPFGLANAMWTLMVNTDTLMVGWFRTPAELGYYAAAQRPISMLSLVPSILVASSLTIMGRLAKDEERDRLRGIIERLIVFSFAIVLPIAVGGAIVAPAIINFLYGSEYLPGTLSFQLLLVTLLITYPAGVITNLVLAHKRQGSYTIAMIAGAAGNLVLDLILIPPFGIAGSVVATIGALAIINGYMWRKAKEIQPFSIAPLLRRIVIATLGMGTVTLGLSFMSVNFIVNIGISAAAYLAILIVLGEPLLNEVKNLVRIG